ncbi:MAG: 50S ribosomal protein L25/general stress protein Ctc [Sedimenticolaceae bacterium]|nr:50S ribosomal protein L25/general stress protein Ctc [Sedimenticolaceae bacterium]
MSENLTINAEARSDMGKGASRRLRHAGLVPGIIYGADKDPEMITVKHNELIHALDDEAFYSSILTVDVGGNSQQVVLKDLQRHPAKPFIMHLDLLRISQKTAIKMQVPLHFINEETAPGVKAGGTASHNMNEVEISCLPADLPEYIEVDCDGLDIGDSIHLSELSLPKGVEIPALALGEDHDSAVVTILASRASKSEEEEEGGEEIGGGEEAASED